MNLFSDNINEFQSTYTKTSGSVLKKNSKKKAIFLNRLNSLEKILPEIKSGYDYHLISCENLGSIELLYTLIKKYNFTEIKICTWSYNASFVELIKENTNKIKFTIIVDMSMQTRKHALFNQLKEIHNENKITFKQHKGIHAKVTICKSEKLNLSVEASANYSNNVRVEQFNISANNELYNFHNKWIGKFV